MAMFDGGCSGVGTGKTVFKSRGPISMSRLMSGVGEKYWERFYLEFLNKHYEVVTFPKSRKKSFLNYVLLTVSCEKERAEALSVYACYVIRGRWKKAEEHINKLDIAVDLYNSQIMDTWKRYKIW